MSAAFLGDEFRFGDYLEVLMSGNMTADDALARAAKVVKATGTLAANATLTMPMRAGAEWFVVNGTSGGKSVTFAPAGGTGVALRPGECAVLVCDGASFRTASPPSAFSSMTSVAVADSTTPTALSTDSAGSRVLILTGTLTTDRELTVPTTGAFEWIVYNATSGGYAVKVNDGTNTVAVRSGEFAHLMTTGSGVTHVAPAVASGDMFVVNRLRLPGRSAGSVAVSTAARSYVDTIVEYLLSDGNEVTNAQLGVTLPTNGYVDLSSTVVTHDEDYSNLYRCTLKASYRVLSGSAFLVGTVKRTDEENTGGAAGCTATYVSSGGALRPQVTGTGSMGVKSWTWTIKTEAVVRQ